jgi:hypothetical protein
MEDNVEMNFNAINWPTVLVAVVIVIVLHMVLKKLV